MNFKKRRINIVVSFVVIFLVISIYLLQEANKELRLQIIEKDQVINDLQSNSISTDSTLTHTSNSVSNEVQVVGSSSTWYGSYQFKFSSGFRGGCEEDIKNNPIDSKIDQDFKELEESDIHTVMDVVNIYGDYISIWQEEMNLTYTKLLGIIDGQYKESLEVSQKNWNELFQSNVDFLHTYILDLYNAGEYGAWLLLEEERASFVSIRDRTLMLKELVYIIDDEVEFYFEQ